MDEESQCQLEALYNMLLKNLTDRMGEPIRQIKSIAKLEDRVEVIKYAMNGKGYMTLHFSVKIVE